jgi:predicted  nucleic acid-binding Zn-ribbon protein
VGEHRRGIHSSRPDQRILHSAFCILHLVMLQDLERLIELQRLDATIAEARATIAQHPQRLAELDTRLEEAKRDVETARERLKANHDARRELEKDVAMYQGRLSKFRDQQGAVKTNKEYQALGHEIETAQRDVGAVEEKMIERMVEADELAAATKRADQQLAARSKEIEAGKKALTDTLASVEASLARSVDARKTLVQSLESRVLALFEQVAKARKGVAICSATRDGLCSVCHVRLRPPVFQQVRHNDGIVQCESCQRILYWIPPPPPAEGVVHVS